MTNSGDYRAAALAKAEDLRRKADAESTRRAYAADVVAYLSLIHI